MYNFQNKLIVLLFIAFSFPCICTSQESVANGLSYEVNRIYPPLSISKEVLNEARTLADLNDYYEPSWIKEIQSVEILTIHDGKLRSVVNNSDILNKAQKTNMTTSDVDKEISVKVLYIPDNTLTNNDVKEINFSFKVNPEIEAEYYSDPQHLRQYLQEKAIDKIPDGSFKGYDLAAVKFTINEVGEIINAHIFESSKDTKTDELLLETIRNMPCWKPAEYAKGHKVKQEFVLTVGNMESCVINLLNIRRDQD